ncbi:MAG TPA: hypothetical protein VNJ02_03955 [Vicinamibacterales bacterium]|nr:hypothetical protein [Vicinamibacterales bacterium]
MIDPARFDLIKRRHGAYGSWAVWAPPTSAPKSNMGDLTVLDELANQTLLETLNPGVVMIGLNISRGFPDQPFRNFHDPSPAANDFKIRYAFHDTVFWGAYMTDVIKGFVEPVSGKLLDYLRGHPQVVHTHLNTLREELLDLGHPKPLILAFGRAAHGLLAENLMAEDFSALVSLTHYSHHISKEDYRDAVHQQILTAGQTA